MSSMTHQPGFTVEKVPIGAIVTKCTIMLADKQQGACRERGRGSLHVVLVAPELI